MLKVLRPTSALADEQRWADGVDAVVRRACIEEIDTHVTRYLILWAVAT